MANETRSEQTVTVRWALRNADATVEEQGAAEVCIPALTSVWMEKICFPDAQTHTQYVSYEMEQDGRIISSGSALFCAPKHFRFRDPHISVQRVGDCLLVSAQAYAKGVELLNENEDWVLEDNYFDMNGGTRKVRILRGDAETVRVRSVYDIR